MYRRTIPDLPAAENVAAAYHEWYEAEPPRPQGAAEGRRPTIEWKIAARSGRGVQSVHLTLNGTPRQAVYDACLGAVRYLPESSLLPGSYHAVIQVEFDSGYSVEQEWSFVVLIAPPPPPSAVQRALHAEVNLFRRSVGLPPVGLDTRLCAAAQEHSQYLLRHRVSGHEQTPEMPGFTGEAPAERLARWGFPENCVEILQTGARSAREALRKLAHAPYHRLSLVPPGEIPLGAGNAGDRWTLLCGISNRRDIVCYPAAGQSDVPCGWDGVETPNPLQLHGVRGPVGFVVSLAYFGPTAGPIRVRHAELRQADDGQPIACFLNTPERDENLRSATLLIPRQPLRPTTTYRALLVGSTAEGVDLTREWTFRTGRS